MKNITGTPARKENFFPREREIVKIVNRIEAGNNLQIAAPRRVGKTSILFYLLDNNVKGYTYVFIDTESIEVEQDYYRKLLKEILKNEKVAKSNRLHKLLKAGEGIFGKIKSISLFGGEISFNEEATNLNYLEELTNFLSGFKLEDDTKLILLIDEFPQTILNIINDNNGNTKAATQFLQSNRALRQNPEINRQVQFIYTGSVSLNHTVATINASAFVNDLSSVAIEPLTKDEATQFIKQLVEENGMSITDEAVTNLLQKVE